MQGRSWMAALTLAAGLVAAPAIVLIASSEDKPAPAPPTREEAPSAPAKPAEPPGTSKADKKTHRVKLELFIAGLSAQGCDIEIKPAHAGCKFREVKEHVDSKGWASVVIEDVETKSADRDCTFAITLREPGQAEQTWKRGLQLKAGAPTVQMLSCYLSSPSKLARANESSQSKAKR